MIAWASIAKTIMNSSSIIARSVDGIWFLSADMSIVTAPMPNKAIRPVIIFSSKSILCFMFTPFMLYG